MAAGAIYGLFAIGVVLVYRGTGAINFAQGEIGTLGLFLAWWSVTEQGLPWIVGAILAIAFAAVVGAGFERFAIRPMVNANRVAIAVATIGFLSLILAFEAKFFSPSPRVLPPPIEGVGVEIAGYFVSPTMWLSFAVVVAVSLGLGVVLRKTDFGLGVLAAAQDPAGARLMGVPFNRVSMFVWGTAAAISALGALLIAPTLGAFAPGFVSLLFLKGLAAAVVGGLGSMSGAIVGGIAVGIIEVWVKDIFGGVTLPGVDVLVVFGVILLVLILRPGGLLAGLKVREAGA